MRDFKIGAGRSVITPYPSKYDKVELFGYDPGEGRYATGVHDDLYSTCMVLDDGQTKAAIIVADLISFPAEMASEIMKKSAEDSGVPKNNMILAATHDHSGTATQSRIRGCGSKNPAYVEELPELVAKSVYHASNAAGRLRKMGSARGRVAGASYNRERRSYLDDELYALFSENDMNELITLTNFGCHNVILERGNLEVSRDLFGALADYLEKKGHKYVVTSNGSAGDSDPIINLKRKAPEAPRPYPSDFGDLEKYAMSIGERVEELRQIAVPFSPQIVVRSRRIRLPLNTKDPEEQVAERIRGSKLYNLWLEELQMTRSGEVLPYIEGEIQAIRIGRDILVGIPAEVVSKTSLAIKERHPEAVLVTYANGINFGYIPSEEQTLKKEGYAYHGFLVYENPYPYSPDAEPEFIYQVDSLLKEMKRKATSQPI